MQKNELKPCPFCGGKVDMKINETTLNCSVICERCNVTMKHNFKGNKKLKEVLHGLMAEEWNRRENEEKEGAGC